MIVSSGGGGTGKYVTDSGDGASGGGIYGGAYFYRCNTVYLGSRGSSYIGNTLLTNKSMYCYNCIESDDESTKTVSTTNVSETPISGYAKIGNGYAKITFLDY